MFHIMLASTSDLGSMLDDPDVIIADTRSFKEYAGGHIPGAVHLDLFAFHWIDTSGRGIAGFDSQARTILSMIGASQRRSIIFYDSVSGMLASRGVWMSMYMSHRSAAMLDGGFSKWRREGRPVETRPNGFRPSDFAGHADSRMLAGFEEIRDNLDALNMVDARSAAEYDGTMIRAARGGHIPGAVNIDWALNLAGDGTFKGVDELSELYDFAAGDRIVTYCQGAYRAANSFLALRMLGFKDVGVYLGSWGEWGNRMDLPVS